MLQIDWLRRQFCPARLTTWQKDFLIKNARSNSFVITHNSKYVFWLEENVSSAVGQNSQLLRETITWSFDSHTFRFCSLKPRQIFQRAGVKQNDFFAFFPPWPQCFPRWIEGLGEKTHCFPWHQSLRASCPPTDNVNEAPEWHSRF